MDVTYTDNENKPPAVTNSVRQAWDDYVDWLDKKGLRGHGDLDQNGLGNKLLSQFIRENPLTPLRPEHVKPIQQDFANYRQFALNQIKQGKAAFSQGTDEGTFMQSLSKLDAWPGSETTKHKFPREYMNFLDEQGKLLNSQDKGFAQTSGTQ